MSSPDGPLVTTFPSGVIPTQSRGPAPNPVFILCGKKGRNPIMSHLHYFSWAGLRVWAEAADPGGFPAPRQTSCCQPGVRYECEAGLWPASSHPPCLPATTTNHRSQPEPFPGRVTAGDPRAVHTMGLKWVSEGTSPFSCFTHQRGVIRKDSRHIQVTEGIGAYLCKKVEGRGTLCRTGLFSRSDRENEDFSSVL